MEDEELEGKMPFSSPEAFVAAKHTGLKKSKGGKFSDFLTSSTVQVKTGNGRDRNEKTYILHASLLVAESAQCYNSLMGDFKEASDEAVDKSEEDSELFGYFVEYLYRNESIINRKVERTIDYVTLARLYTLADRLCADKFKAGIQWRFLVDLHTNTNMTLQEICDLLQIAALDICQNDVDDLIRSQIFWYAGYRINELQESHQFRQIIGRFPQIAASVCLQLSRAQPAKPGKPLHVDQNWFKPESEYDLIPTGEHEPEPLDGEVSLELSSKGKKKKKKKGETAMSGWLD